MSAASPFLWTFRTLQDAYNPRPPITWAVQGLFQVPSLNVVYGPPGCLKSMLLADCAVCVAAGVPWLAPMPNSSSKVQGLATLGAPVLWIDFDNGERRTDDRFAAIGRAYSVPAAVPLYYVSMPSTGLFMDKIGHADALEATITGKGVKFVVLDNLGQISGDADEISAEMVPVMAHLRRVAEGAGVCLVVIHHQRKGNGTKGREGETLRGHSSIEAALDLALLIDREKDAPDLKMRSTKSRGADVVERAALFSYQHAPGTLDLDRACFFGAELVKDTPGADLDDAIIETLTDKGAPMNQSALVKEMQVQDKAWTRARVRKALDSLEVLGRVQITKGRNNESLYAV